MVPQSATKKGLVPHEGTHCHSSPTLAWPPGCPSATPGPGHPVRGTRWQAMWRGLCPLGGPGGAVTRPQPVPERGGPGRTRAYLGGPGPGGSCRCRQARRRLLVAGQAAVGQRPGSLGDDIGAVWPWPAWSLGQAGAERGLEPGAGGGLCPGLWTPCPPRGALPVGAELEAGELALGPWPTPSGFASFLPLLTPEISKHSGGEKVRWPRPMHLSPAPTPTPSAQARSPGGPMSPVTRQKGSWQRSLA